MQIPVMGTVSSLVRNLSLEKKWELKKKELGKSNQENSQIAAYKQQVADLRKSQAISSIEAKMKSGIPLSGADMEYLRLNAPTLYEKAQAIQKEREQYRKELESCRTKEDVEKLKTRKLQQYVAEAKAVMSSSIPAEKKKEKMEEIGMRMATVMDEHANFTQSSEYASLPDDWEDEKRKKGKKSDKADLNIDDEHHALKLRRQKSNARLEKSDPVISEAQEPDGIEQTQRETQPQAPEASAKPEEGDAAYTYNSLGKPDMHFSNATPEAKVSTISIEA